jgi:hypothetical protein
MVVRAIEVQSVARVEEEEWGCAECTTHDPSQTSLDSAFASGHAGGVKVTRCIDTDRKHDENRPCSRGV